MVGKRLFKAGQVVKIMGVESAINGEMAEVLQFYSDENAYLLRLANGSKIEVKSCCVVRWMNNEELKRLHKAQLRHLSDFTLLIKDKEWFEQITNELSTM